MPLNRGDRLGPYEILNGIGAGGMGEVYRARDTRLARDVAIKVLPPGFARDPDRRARFEREARAVAALSHPNILAIHDVGEASGGTPDVPLTYAVMELLEGETLRARLTAHGALPVRQAIDVAIQVARGLSAAHDKGLVHRDLKPENVFLLADGQVKILDFGLAKTRGDGSGAGQQDPAASAETVAATSPGMVMGTVGYMAPEQVQGQTVDARADLFALGAMLYEMLSGQRAFKRATAAETMTAILRDDPPDLSGTRPELSPTLDRIVRHCLEKNPAQRFQTARDVAFALEALSGSATGVVPAGTTNLPHVRRVAGPLTLTGVGVLALVAGYALRSALGAAATPPPVFQTLTWDPQWVSNARFGPDGKTVVYSAAATGNVPDLFVLRPDALVAQRLGAPHTQLLSVSRTGELAVLTGVTFINHRLFMGTLARMTLDGATRPWMEHVREADWAPDGSTLAIVHDLGTKDQLEFPIGTALRDTTGYLSNPRVSPDGSHVAFIDHSIRYDDRGSVKMVDRTGTVTDLTGEFWGVEGLAWSPDGRILYFSATGPNGPTFYPQAVSLADPMKPRAALPTLDWVEIDDVAADGRFLATRNDSRLSMRALLPGQSAEREFPWLDFSFAADLSADGQWLLFSDESQNAGVNYAVGLWKTDGSPAVQLGPGSAVALSPDTRWAIGYVPSPAPGFYVLYPTGPGQSRRLDFAGLDPRAVGSVAWWPDGSIFVCGRGTSQPPRCYRQALGGGPLEPVTPEGVTSGLPAPDGRTVLGRTTTGSWELITGGVAVRPVLGTHADDQVVGWSRDSRAVFVQASTSVPARIERLDLLSGARTTVRELMPPDRAGVISVMPGAVLDDGRAYCYSYWRDVSTLVTVRGVR
jgi:eukaryotic-like serine/threonine-protein kinase